MARAKKYPTLEEVFAEAGLLPKMLELGRKRGRAEGHKEGREQGRAEGLAEGSEQTSEKIARNALAKGMPLELIHDITGLDIETIQGLAPRS